MTLSKHIQQNKGQLIIVSDTSLNTQHCSAFSWTIATTTTELWTGAGTSPSTQRDAHSRWSEGCGFLSAFTFLKNTFKPQICISHLTPQLLLDIAITLVSSNKSMHSKPKPFQIPHKLYQMITT